MTNEQMECSKDGHVFDSMEENICRCGKSKHNPVRGTWTTIES